MSAGRGEAGKGARTPPLAPCTSNTSPDLHWALRTCINYKVTVQCALHLHYIHSTLHASHYITVVTLITVFYSLSFLISNHYKALNTKHFCREQGRGQEANCKGLRSAQLHDRPNGRQVRDTDRGAELEVNRVR